ncbi:MAG: hypothetical protein ABIO55_04380 [Ginsengibacter sp.]
MTKYFFKISLAFGLLLISFQSLFSQAEVEPWGNITGIRIDGQLMEFESNISVVQKDWVKVTATGKERQRPKFSRNGDAQMVSSNIDSLSFTETVTDAGRGVANVNVQLTPKSNMSVEGIYYTFMLPVDDYADAGVQLDNSKAVKLNASESALNNYLQTAAKSIQFITPKHQLKVMFEDPVNIIIKSGTDKNKKFIQVFVPLQKGDLEKGQTIAKTFSVTASGSVDKKPIILTLNTAISGRPFKGLGGNFRLQNPRVDPQVIDYCLKNLRVVWGRVEMPWRQWHPVLDSSPIIQAKAGKLNAHVKESMEMAQRLYKMGIPVILTAWFPPAWAVTGPLSFRPANGIWGNPLDQTKTNEIYKSIADYIQYLKDEYGVEITDFSFNESDLGINIRQTGDEHAKLIRELGAYLATRGFKTKMLLGDNSDANTYTFVDPAIADPATHPYIGYVSFHSWRGWDSTTLQKWDDAATKLNIPLLVGEGSTDAAAWAYPAIFQEQTYALKEINLYTRILAICKPESILQWQLTSDYSPLAGGGVAGDTGALRPTQRFWNLKQLASIPEGLKAMPIRSSAANVSCAALGDNDKGVYSIQLVNNASSRHVTVTGLPKKVKSLRMFVTTKKLSMQEGKLVPVVNGKATFILEATSYTSLESK